jgi:cell division GTPase FtsZ
MKETEHLRRFLYSIGHDIEFIWGAIYDDDLEESLKITIIATGFKIDEIPSIGKIESSSTPMDDLFITKETAPAVVKEEPKPEVETIQPTVQEPEAEEEPEEEIIDWDSWTSDENEDDEIPPSQRKR